MISSMVIAMLLSLKTVTKYDKKYGIKYDNAHIHKCDSKHDDKFTIEYGRNIVSSIVITMLMSWII